MKAIKVPGVGEVPAPALIGVVALAGGFVLYRYWASAGTAPAGDGEATDELGAEDAVVGDQYAVGTYQPPVTQYAGTDDDTGSSSGAPAVTTDAEWVQACVEDLGEFGINGATVALALGRYLQRKRLTAAQVDIVTQAIALHGRPPQSPSLPILPAVGSTPTRPPKPKPKPKPKPAPAGPVYVTVRRGDTLNEIVARHGTTVGKIRNFPQNRYIFQRDPQGDKIYPGDRVRVK